MDQGPPDILTEVGDDLAFRDELTGLYNRRLLAQVLDQWWERLVGGRDRLTMVMIDLDRFKEVNDTYGHLTGDGILRRLADVLRGSFRRDDIVARYGGDEFVIILPGVDAATAGRLADRAREALEGADLRVHESGEPIGFPVSFTIGTASYPADGRSGARLLELADRRLLDRKRSQRTRQQSRPEGRPRTGRDALVLAALTLAAVGVVATTAVLVGSLLPTPRQLTPTPIRPRTDPAREAELLARIGELQAQLEELTEAPRQESTPQRETELRRIESLQGQIRSLQEELAARTSMAREQAETGADEEPARATPATPATQGARSVAESPQGDDASVVPEAPGEASSIGPETVANATGSTGINDRAAPVVSLPELVRYTAPGYPDPARRMRKQASVTLRIRVDAKGKVVEAEPVGEPVGFGFEHEAQRAAFNAVFRPGTIDGVASEMETTLTIHFRLDRP